VSAVRGRGPVTSVVLDRDGTVFDFSRMFLRFVLDLHAVERVPPPPDAEIMGAAYWDEVVSGRLRVGAVRVRDRVDLAVRDYMSHGALFPGVPEMLVRLSEAGIRVALVSAWVGTRATLDLLEGYGVGHCVSAVLTRDDLAGLGLGLDDATAKGVLARRALIGAGHRWGERLCVVGDSPADVALGRGLDALVVGVRTGNGHRLPETPPDGPDLFLDSAAELHEVLTGSRGPAARERSAEEGPVTSSGPRGGVVIQVDGKRSGRT